MKCLDAQAGIGDRAPLALHLLALFGRKRVQKVGEVAIAAVAPVELHAAPDQAAGGFERGAFVVAHEQALPVRGMRVGGQCDRRVDQRAGRIGCGIAGDQQARARRGREGDTGDQLGEVGQTRLTPGGIPAVVHGKVAVPVVPGVKRQQAGQAAIRSAQHDVHRPPANRPMIRDAAFRRAEKSRIDERVAAGGESPPVLIGEAADAGEDLGLEHGRVVQPRRVATADFLRRCPGSSASACRHPWRRPGGRFRGRP